MNARSLTEAGVRLIGVYLCAMSVIGILNGIYHSFGSGRFFGAFFEAILTGGISLVVGAVLAFAAGMIVETIMGPDTPKAP